jgi:hypothetical protein
MVQNRYTRYQELLEEADKFAFVSGIFHAMWTNDEYETFH